MLLLPHQVGLGEPALNLGIDLGRLVQPKDVHLVAW